MKAQTKSRQKKSTRKPEPKSIRGRFRLRNPRTGRSFVEFPGMKGRTVDKIEFYSIAGDHCISVSFADKTALTLIIDTGFTVEAMFENWKTGNGRLLKQWPVLHSQE